LDNLNLQSATFPLVTISVRNLQLQLFAELSSLRGL